MDALVEIDVGGGRCGVQLGQAAVDLARIVDAADGLRFGGLQAYHGSIHHVRDHAERHAHAQDAVDKARMTVEALSAEGFTCDIVGGAGTGTFPRTKYLVFVADDEKEIAEKKGNHTFAIFTN